MNKAKLIVFLSIFSISLASYLSLFAYKQANTLNTYKTKAQELEADRVTKGKTVEQVAEMAQQCEAGCPDTPEGRKMAADASNAVAKLEIETRNDTTGINETGEAATKIYDPKFTPLATRIAVLDGEGNPVKRDGNIVYKYNFVTQQDKEGLQQSKSGGVTNPAAKAEAPRGNTYRIVVQANHTGVTNPNNAILQAAKTDCDGKNTVNTKTCECYFYNGEIECTLVNKQ